MREVNLKKAIFAGKVRKIAKMLVRMVAFEGLQPMVTEAFLKEGDNIRCGWEDMRLEEMKDSNGNWKFWIAAIIAINIVFFAVVIFVVYRIFKHLELKLQRNSDELWGHTERRYNDIWQYTDWRSNDLEFRATECEIGVRDCEIDADDIDLLKDYVGRIHHGPILNGGFVERETPSRQAILSYDLLNEITQETS